ncbi:MAG: transcription antitermination factor NusB [Acidimicrobiia bacterium]
MSIASARDVACQALVRIEDGAYSHVVLPTILRASGLEARDRAFVTDIVYGTVRGQRRLDHMLTPHGRRPLGSLDAEVRAALRIGAHQLANGVPPHAAVAATVDAAPPRARGYVNAVLRSLSRAGPPWPDPTSEAVALSYPDWVLQRLAEDLGDADARAALLACNEPPAVALRPQMLLNTSDALEAELRAGGAQVERGRLVDDALVVRGAGDLAAHPALAEGRATPQDQASQAVIRYADPTPGARVLDVASAPGGKATATAERVGPDGLVVALDLDAGRLRLVREAATRLRLSNVSTARADARRLPTRLGAFDLVVVDAPCSGLGALRRRPDLRWRVDPSMLEPLADLQVALVREAAGAVRPGGTLLYSVCTPTQVETVGVAARVIEQLPGFTPLAPPPGWRPHGPGGLVLPQDFGTDGMFILALRCGR